MNQHAATHKNQNVKSSPSRSSSNPNSDCDVSQPKMLHGVCNDMKYTVSEASNYFLILYLSFDFLDIQKLALKPYFSAH